MFIYLIFILQLKVLSNPPRSQFSQFPYGLQSNGLNQNSPQFNPSMYIHPSTPGNQTGTEVFQSSMSAFRIGPVRKILNIYLSYYN